MWYFCRRNEELELTTLSMNSRLVASLIFLLWSIGAFAKTYSATSPDGNVRVDVDVDKQIVYSINLEGEPVLTDGVISLIVNGNTLGKNPKLSDIKRNSVSETIIPAVPFKFAEIENEYEQMSLRFKGGYAVEFRVFNDGVAYRIVTDLKGEIEVTDEVFGIGLPEGSTIHCQLAGSFKTSCEEPYSHLSADEWNGAGDKYTLLPLLIELKDDRKILVSESALTDYPAMFLNPQGTNNRLNAIFPKVPLKFGPDGDRSVKILEEAEYIAKTEGRRAFPWRYFVVTSNDGEIIENTMTARLAEKPAIADPSWIKPGTTTWEWWNGATPYGQDVDFVAGCNTATYKYFIDFASKYGVDYVLLDEGWADSTSDPFTPNASLDLGELIGYGKEKGVGVILWLPWLTVENNFDLFERYSAMGVKGVKIDFMDRSDQWMVNFYERVAAEAARNGLFVDFHGSFKPAGLEYKYPNVLSYEGVRGMEQMGGCTPDNSAYFPYLRNAVGPMDYTPGAMLSYQPEKYRCDRPNSGSIGTRAYQMALYILWETGLQMLADNPTLYMANDDCTRFIASVPVTSDVTKALAAKAGEYTVVAKKKGDKWYVGGITNNDKPWREFDITLDFLGDGEYTMTSFEDGVNAPVQAMHYVKNEKKVRRGDTVRIRMSRNGGYAAVIE